MSFLSALDISGSALTAQKFRMNIIAQNMANTGTTRTEDGEPYRRKLSVFSERTGAFDSVLGKELAGVEVTQVAEDGDDFKLEYDPDNPDADENGYVRLPNINTLDEMVDMISASRAYEANVTAFNAMKELATAALNIGK
ncbi:MAG: flagellar basal body rod protein FlgC [Clostridiaceae bacterium]|nr:flagellar basal body rod protein FlgC [Clostridiaceae bacterium]